jgi:hypothetical protein
LAEQEGDRKFFRRGFSLAPSAGVCLSISDLGKSAAANLEVENGRSILLRARATQH